MRGKKGEPHLEPDDPPRRRANKRRGRGTYATDRPPIINLISRDTGEHRYFVCHHADGATCHALIDANVPSESTLLCSDEWRSYHGAHPNHHTVCHSANEWARDDDGDGRREVHW